MRQTVGLSGISNDCFNFYAGAFLEMHQRFASASAQCLVRISCIRLEQVEKSAMQVWKCWRTLVLSLVMSSFVLTNLGCGGGAPATGDVLTPDKDPTLDPKTDSTMNSGVDPSAPAIVPAVGK